MESYAIRFAQYSRYIPKINRRFSCEYRVYCKAYLGDFAILSCYWNTQLKHLGAVLFELTELNFTMNIKKCIFAKSEIKYLGHFIEGEKYRPEPEKLRAIEATESTKSKTALKSATFFLTIGSVNIYCFPFFKGKCTNVYYCILV